MNSRQEEEIAQRKKLFFRKGGRFTARTKSEYAGVQRVRGAEAEGAGVGEEKKAQSQGEEENRPRSTLL